MQDCKEESGQQFIKFDFLTGSQEIKLAIFADGHAHGVGVQRRTKKRNAKNGSRMQDL